MLKKIFVYKKNKLRNQRNRSPWTIAICGAMQGEEEEEEKSF
jgi:hypothetical protein